MQAYRTAQLPEDVVIQQVKNIQGSAGTAEVLLIVAHFEGLGQFSDRHEAVFSVSDREAAERYVASREAESYETAPNWCDVMTVVVNRRESPPPAPKWLTDAARGALAARHPQ